MENCPIPIWIMAFSGPNRFPSVIMISFNFSTYFKTVIQVLTGKYGEDSKLIYDLADQGGEILALRYFQNLDRKSFNSLLCGQNLIYTMMKIWPHCAFRPLLCHEQDQQHQALPYGKGELLKIKVSAIAPEAMFIPHVLQLDLQIVLQTRYTDETTQAYCEADCESSISATLTSPENMTLWSPMQSA